jgi:hypothetical protein
MTPEERERMNELCAGIQEEKNYDKFAALLREMGELIGRKEQRRFQDYPKLIWQRTRPWTTVSAVVNKILKSSLTRDPDKAEISILPADYLFREVRITNSLTTPEGEPVALKHGARVDVTFEAEPADTVKQSTPAA